MPINYRTKESVEDPPKCVLILRETLSSDLTLAYIVDKASTIFLNPGIVRVLFSTTLQAQMCT
jgi:hypothetical protein